MNFGLYLPAQPLVSLSLEIHLLVECRTFHSIINDFHNNVGIVPLLYRILLPCSGWMDFRHKDLLITPKEGNT